MTFVNYKNSNNASSKLIADITASTTTLLITSGDEAIFPSEFPFLLTIEKLDSEGNVILREIVKATAGNQNSFVVVRGAGTCVQDDTSTARVQSNAVHGFSAGDRISLYWTSEQVKDIQDRLEASVEGSAVANEYDDSETYEVGDVVMYKGKRYVCNTEITTAEAFDSDKWTETPLQTDIQNIEDDITELQLKSYASDHLEEEVLVGCYYEMGDGVFPQNTPEYDNCSVEANVGDVALNTELHIQRQGSGTASNELKLKIKSVGSPTANLYVEVRRGISDINTERKITTWYGDENEIIATGVVSKSDITSSFQEITVQLDNDFGETEGELLDVVVYQQLKNVNSEKYFVIACDSIQRSEPFQYLSVDGVTRIRSGYAPFCTSDGFASVQLSKAYKTGNYGLPRSLKSLGEKVTVTTFGKSIDGERVYHEPDKEIEYNYSPKVFTVVRQETSYSDQFFIEYKDDAAGLTQGSEVFDDFFGYSGVRLNNSGVETGTVNLKNMSAETGLTSGDNVMVKFPLRGIKITKDTGYTGATEYLTMSITEEPNAEDKGYQYYAFSRGTLSNPIKKDKLYLGVYEITSGGRSLSGNTIYTGQAYASYKTAATYDNYSMVGFYQREYIKALYMMKYCHGNSQVQIGYGNVNGSLITTSGGSNSILGTTGGDTVNKTSVMKIFGLENWWGNTMERIGGAVTQSYSGTYDLTVRIALNAADASGAESAGYETLMDSYTRSGTLKHIAVSLINGEYSATKTMFLSGDSGSGTSYYCDDCSLVKGKVLMGSGCYSDNTSAGVFFTRTTDATNTGAYGGSRVMYL